MPKNFKNKEAYNKFNAYIHIHGVPHEPGKEVEIAGHKHKPHVSAAEEACAKRGYCRTHSKIHYPDVR